MVLSSSQVRVGLIEASSALRTWNEAVVIFDHPEELPELTVGRDLMTRLMWEKTVVVLYCSEVL